MSKRKQADEVEEEGSDDQTPELVDVNFDYYNVKADNDYHAVHRLLIQLLGADAERVETGPLTDLVTRVAEESGVGSTIKTEEEEGSDPYAILTVISCHDHAGLRGLIDYVLSKISGEPGFHGTLTRLLEEHPKYHVGLVVSERLINMPVQVMPPMYEMLLGEIADAVAEGRGYAFTHYLFLSRVYRAPEEHDAKRARTEGVCGYHAEDAEIMEGSADATETFTDGVGMRAMLVPGERVQRVVERVRARYGV